MSSTLNVARTATQAEIAEQFRTLSLIFHPDKQHSEESIRTATERFQELSKAYEVLSDSFLRPRSPRKPPHLQNAILCEKEMESELQASLLGRFDTNSLLVLHQSVGLIPRFVEAFGKYEANGTLLSARIRQKLAGAKPTFTLIASRQLYYKRPEVASIELNITGVPRYSFMLHFSDTLVRSNVHVTDDDTLPSVSGIRNLISSTSIGVRFLSVLPSFAVEQIVNLTELSLQLRLSVECSLQNGFEWECSGSWAAPHSANRVLVSTRSNFLSGVSFALDVVHEDNVFSLPIILSMEPEPTIACWAFILPPTIAMLGYYLVAKPRRRKQRMERIRAARREQEEHTGMYKDREATMNLLIGPAKKSKEAESSKGGMLDSLIADDVWSSYEQHGALLVKRTPPKI
ncbi:hypothetical protein H0H87_006086 [Tephrocybe sp. NHM501043]|nr:hypothetical protein H0H87_006086 [Tephrocybe sp. NHM501043]